MIHTLIHILIHINYLILIWIIHHNNNEQNTIEDVALSPFVYEFLFVHLFHFHLNYAVYNVQSYIQNPLDLIIILLKFIPGSNSNVFIIKSHIGPTICKSNLYLVRFVPRNNIYFLKLLYVAVCAQFFSIVQVRTFDQRPPAKKKSFSSWQEE